MKRVLIPILILLLFSLRGGIWAKDKDSPTNAASFKDGWENPGMDVDTEVNGGEDDDKGDESAGSSKFKKDEDDSYAGSSTDGDDWLKSKFKDDKDEDWDTETDNEDDSTQ